MSRRDWLVARKGTSAGRCLLRTSCFKASKPARPATAKGIGKSASTGPTRSHARCLFNEEKSPHPNYEYISSTLCCWQYGHTAKFFTSATCFQLALGWGVGLFEQLRKSFVDCLLAYLETTLTPARSLFFSLFAVHVKRDCGKNTHCRRVQANLPKSPTSQAFRDYSRIAGNTAEKPILRGTCKHRTAWRLDF
jgi:hypothetical protein